MRSFLVGIAISTVLFASADGAFAQRAFSNKELNERVSALRTRLQNYQVKSARKIVDRIPADAETIAITTENLTNKIVEKPFMEIDSRPDASLTVLFHDTEFASPVRQNLTTAALETKVSTHADEEARLRQEKFDALRLKVQNATRRTRSEAMKINKQVAQLP